MKSTKITAIVATLLMCLPALTLLAQNPPNDSASGPIDGGITILIAGAAAMGYKKIRGKRKGENNIPDKH